MISKGSPVAILPKVFILYSPVLVLPHNGSNISQS